MSGLSTESFWSCPKGCRGWETHQGFIPALSCFTPELLCNFFLFQAPLAIVYGVSTLAAHIPSLPGALQGWTWDTAAPRALGDLRGHELRLIPSSSQEKGICVSQFVPQAAQPLLAWCGEDVDAGPAPPSNPTEAAEHFGTPPAIPWILKPCPCVTSKQPQSLASHP